MSFDSLNQASKEIFDNLNSLPLFSMNAPYINEFESLSLTSVTKFLAAPDLERGWQRVVLDIKKKQTEMEDGSQEELPSTGTGLFSHSHQ